MSTKYFFVLKGYPRISETFISQEIYLLEQKGYDISILSMRQPREDMRQPINKLIKAPVVYTPEYIFEEPVEIFSHNLRTLTQFPLAYLKYFLIALYTSATEMRREHIKRFLQAGWAISKCQFKTNPYHLHSHFAHSPTTLTYYVHKITGLKYSISAHAKDIYTISKEELKSKIESCEFLTTCTSFNYHYIRDKILKTDKVKLSYHGINTDYFKPTEIDCLSSQQPYLLCSVGRLVDKKGYDVILKALSLLKRKGINFRYDVFGAGELESEVKGLISDLDLKDQVRLLGAASHETISERLAQKGIFICGSKISSTGDRDGIPNTIAEAMSMELAVVATKVSGIPELIQHKESGWLVEPESPAEMSDAIEYLIQNPVITEQIAKNGRRRVKEFFDANKCLGDLEDSFKNHLTL